MSRDGPGVVVIKNTFLEVGDHGSLREKNDAWRRQVSEPAKVCTERQVQDSLSELEKESGEAHARVLEVEEQQTGISPMGFQSAAEDFFAFPEHSQPSASSGAGPSTQSEQPQVLLLSETLPAGRRERGGGPSGNSGGGPERPGGRGKDSLSQMKNNDITKMEPPWTDVTTVMMRNLPNKYTQQMLLEELSDGGFRLQTDFDFFYLPMDHTNAANLGYCFINFCQTAMANAFASAFSGKKMRRFNSNKTVVVMPASIQGYDKNYSYYSSTRVVQAEDPQYRPLFLRPGATGGGKQGGSQSGSKAGGKGKRGDDDMFGRRGKGQKGKGKDAPLRWDTGGLHGQDQGKGHMGGQKSGMDMNYGAGGGYAWNPIPMQMQGMGAAPPFVGMAAPQAPQGPRGSQLVVCSSCGNECSSAHRFCAFCGSPISGPGDGGGGGGGGGMRQASAMQQDAAPFVMPMAPQGAGWGQLQHSYELDASRAWPGVGPPSGAGAPGGSGGSADHYSDAVTDELDVVRGRMMLLAALKDMEQREAAAGRG